MNTKEIILKRLGWAKLGKKPNRFIGYDDDGTMAHNNIGYEIPMEVLRCSGEKDWVLGRYDKDARVYRVAYDPNIKAGRIEKILNVYSEPK